MGNAALTLHNIVTSMDCSLNQQHGLAKILQALHECILACHTLLLLRLDQQSICTCTANCLTLL